MSILFEYFLWVSGIVWYIVCLFVDFKLRDLRIFKRLLCWVCLRSLCFWLMCWCCWLWWIACNIKVDVWVWVWRWCLWLVWCVCFLLGWWLFWVLILCVMCLFNCLVCVCVWWRWMWWIWKGMLLCLVVIFMILSVLVVICCVCWWWWVIIWMWWMEMMIGYMRLNIRLCWGIVCGINSCIRLRSSARRRRCCVCWWICFLFLLWIWKIMILLNYWCSVLWIKSVLLSGIFWLCWMSTRRGSAKARSCFIVCNTSTGMCLMVWCIWVGMLMILNINSWFGLNKKLFLVCLLWMWIFLFLIRMFFFLKF